MEKKQKDKKVLERFSIFVFILSVLVLLFSVYLSREIIIDKSEIFVSVEVANVSGFDLNTSALTFGKLVPGAKSSRKIEIKNNYNFPIVVEFDSEGNINELLGYDKLIYINPNEAKEAGFIINTYLNTTQGVYIGIVSYVIKKDI
ncbi:MAG TPA: hypothetical protein VJH65_01970 [Candidatus Nanoarchaeia archaeon]|nr:hypothetical protein [Candidatus Nanoarchaeia archaeon]